jgi:hypothetical protein
MGKARGCSLGWMMIPMRKFVIGQSAKLRYAVLHKHQRFRNGPTRATGQMIEANVNNTIQFLPCIGTLSLCAPASQRSFVPAKRVGQAGNADREATDRDNGPKLFPSHDSAEHIAAVQWIIFAT